MPMNATLLANKIWAFVLVVPLLLATMANIICESASWVTSLVTADLARTALNHWAITRLVIRSLVTHRAIKT